MGNKKKIGIICAAEMECREFIEGIRGKKPKSIGNVRFHFGTRDVNEVIVAVAGIGKTNAAHGCTLLIEKYRPDLIINVGVGGCFPRKGLETGDIVVAEKELFADEGVLVSRGFMAMRETGMCFVEKGEKKFFNEFPASRAMVKKFKRIEKRLPYPVTYGNFLTVSTVTGTHRRALYLGRKYDALCENMEGAAVFQISHVYGIPCFEMRGISNIVEKRDKKKWEIAKASDHVQAALNLFLGSL